MTKISILASVFGLTLGTAALAHGGPLTEQQKKDFMDEFKSVGRIERLYVDAQTRNTPKADESYEKMYELVKQACNFVEDKSQKDDTTTVVLESTEVGCPVTMKLIDQAKDIGEGTVATARKTVYVAGDLMKALNDVIEMQDLAHGQTVTIKNDGGGVISSEENSEGFVVSQKNGKSEYSARSVSSTEYVGNNDVTKITGEFTLNTKLADVEVEAKMTYQFIDGVFSKEVFLNGEKVETGSDLETLF